MQGIRISNCEIVARWDANVGDRATDLVSGADPVYPRLLEHAVAVLSSRQKRVDRLTLDIGCGLGFSTDALREAGYLTVGIDPSRESVLAARGRFHGAFRVETAESHLRRVGPERYDVLTLIMVLHCLPDYQQTLRASSTLLRKGGSLLVVLPHPGLYLQHKDYFPSLDFDYHIERAFEVPFKVRNGRVHRKSVYYFHRPLQSYANMCSDLGLRQEAIYEPSSGEEDVLNDVVSLLLTKSTG